VVFNGSDIWCQDPGGLDWGGTSGTRGNHPLLVPGVQYLFLAFKHVLQDLIDETGQAIGALTDDGDSFLTCIQPVSGLVLPNTGTHWPREILP